ncbi:hypothetical protein JHW43_001636 [Diplocarpon mali]|nr:hypothetical protein JHW43_001636 [Diplocarpon mali]
MVVGDTSVRDDVRAVLEEMHALRAKLDQLVALSQPAPARSRAAPTLGATTATRSSSSAAAASSKRGREEISAGEDAAAGGPSRKRVERSPDREREAGEALVTPEPSLDAAATHDHTQPEDKEAAGEPIRALVQDIVDGVVKPALNVLQLSIESCLAATRRAPRGGSPAEIEAALGRMERVVGELVAEGFRKAVEEVAEGVLAEMSRELEGVEFGKLSSRSATLPVCLGYFLWSEAAELPVSAVYAGLSRLADSGKAKNGLWLFLLNHGVPPRLEFRCLVSDSPRHILSCFAVPLCTPHYAPRKIATLKGRRVPSLIETIASSSYQMPASPSLTPERFGILADHSRLNRIVGESPILLATGLTFALLRSQPQLRSTRKNSGIVRRGVFEPSETETPDIITSQVESRPGPVKTENPAITTSQIATGPELPKTGTSDVIKSRVEIAHEGLSVASYTMPPRTQELIEAPYQPRILKAFE